MAVTLDDLTTMSQTRLDDHFTSSQLGEIPDGDAEGTPIAPGTDVEAPILVLVRTLGTHRLRRHGEDHRLHPPVPHADLHRGNH
jgi:hypothetical protein